MQKTDFNIFSQLESELDDFYTTKIKIGGSTRDQKIGYEFSQPKLLNTIQYVGGSKFEKGESKDKIYLNNSVFRADVASKQIDLDVANFKFIPAELHDKNICILKRREFKQWAKKTGFGIELNDMVEKYPFWGHLVAKRIKGGYELIPIDKIRNQQDAKDLNTATYAIIEHNLEAWEAQAMPDWDLSGLEYKWNDKLTVFERYGRVPTKWYNEYKGIKGEVDDTESVDTVSYIVQDKKNKKKDGQLLFCEKITKRPFKEVKWKHVEGRWLGMGEIENNLDNQKARNAVFNLRLRAMTWAAKNIFQSTDETTANNLVSEVKDGDVITITDQGITPINTQTKSLADFNALDEVIEGNADQKSFTYEVATGEQLKSGTPFRMGVVLSNSVNNHFGLKREKLVLFVKDLLYDYVLADFKKDTKAGHKVTMASGEEGYNELFEIYKGVKAVEFIHKYVKDHNRVPRKEEIELFKSRLKDFEIDVEENAYDIRDSVDIVVSGEAIDIESKMATLSTFYQLLAQRNDPRAEAILDKIAILSDEYLPKAEAQEQMAGPQNALQQIQQLAQPTQKNETI